jgi:hypothetical protein
MQNLINDGSRRKQEFYREFDNIYINLNQSNKSYDGTYYNRNHPLARFDIQNDSPFFDNASEYYCSVLRFDVPQDEIPIMIMPVLPFPNTNPNLSIWECAIDNNGTLYKRNLIYFPEFIQNANPGTTPVGYPPSTPIFYMPTLSADNPNPRTEYYFIYAFSTVINMLNAAIAGCCTDAGLIGEPPYFVIDPVTELVSVVVPTIFTNISGTPSGFPTVIPNRPQIVMNDALFQLFESFAFYYSTQGVYLLLNGFNNLPTSENAYYDANTQLAPTAPPTFFKFTQEVPILQLWSSLKDILFITNRIPINSESISIDNAGNTTNIPILTDFTPAFTSGRQLLETIYYIPTAQYRLIDMLATTPLQTVDITIFWRSIYGDLYPVRIAPGRELNVKLAFLRKDLYKSPNIL